MKNLWLCLFSVLLVAACKGEISNEQRKSQLRTTIQLDTGRQAIDTVLLRPTDTAFVVRNKFIKDDIGDKHIDYTVHIYFTHPNWPVLTYKNAISVELFLAEDLNGDHQRELLLRPKWFSNCWASLSLFSFQNTRWKLIKYGKMYFCSNNYPLSKRIIKTASGYALLSDSLADDKFIILKKELKF